MNTTTGELYHYDTQAELERIQFEARQRDQEVVKVSELVAEAIREGMPRARRRFLQRQAAKKARK